MSSEITINSNIAAIQTQRRLGQNSSALNRVFERLSSGQRINRASDDAAGLAISDSLRADRRVLSQGVRNLNDGISLLNIGEGALSELTNIVTRVQELAEQAANGTLGYRQRQSLDKEAQQLSKEYSRIAQTAEFNGIRMFDGSVSSLQLQSGYGSAGGVIASVGGTKGTGTFVTAVSYAAESFISNGVAIGDLNGDGFLDLATSGVGGSGRATVRLGTGNGTFSAATSYVAESGASFKVKLGDLNGDGVLDLVTSGSGAGGRATVRIGSGNGTFGASTSYLNDTNSSFALALGDLNGDGVLDMVTAGTSGAAGSAVIRLGTGSGTFGAALSYSTETSGSNAVTLGDVNGDSILDLVTAGYSGGAGMATIRLGTGNGTFGAAAAYATQASASNDVTLGDLNNDGILDLISAGSGGGGFASIRLGNGNGTFGTASTYATETTFSKGVIVGDYNGDGILDLATAGYDGSAGKSTIRLGNGNGSFGAATSYATETKFSDGITQGDVDGDGVLDLVTSGYNGGSSSATIRFGTTSNGVGALLPFSLQYRDSALQAMPDLDRALKRISAHRGQIGAFQSRVNSAINNVQITIENYAGAESQIRDTDVAQEAANLAKGKILQQAAASVLSQANQEPQIALKLLNSA